MSRAFLIACALCATGLLFPRPTPAAGRPRVAVLDLRAVHGVAPGTTSVLTAIVVDEAARGGVDVVSQTDILTMLGYEKQRRMLGCSDDSCLAELGGALGADYVLSGQVGEIGSRYHVSVQLLDARRGKVISRGARFSERNEDALAEAVQQSVRALVSVVRRPGAGPAPVPAPLAKAPRPVAPGAPASVAASAPEPTARPGRTSAWIALGAGAALLGGGAAFGLQAKAARDDLAQADWRSPAYAATYDAKSAAVKRNALLSNVCWGAGAVSTGVGVFLLWRSRSPAPAIAVAPAIGDGGAGLVAAGRF